MKAFTVPSILTRVSSLADGGMNVGFHTKELSANEKVEIMDFHNKQGWLMFKENEVKDEEVPTQDAEFNDKTPSQRLRGVLYVYWQQFGQKIEPDFTKYYLKTMESIIQKFKDKLI